MVNALKFEYVGQPEFPSDLKVYFCVWRRRPPNYNKAALHIVDSENINLDDIVFCECGSFSGYSIIVDFVRNEDGRISDYILRDSGIDFDTSFKMAKTTHEAVDDFLVGAPEKESCVVVSLKSKATKDRK